MRGHIRASLASSLASLGVATCCVMPMAMMLLGLGGSWIAVFGTIAAASFYVLGASTVIIALAWIAVYRRHAVGHMKAWLTISTVLTALAWILVFNETRINDFLISLM